MPRTAAALTPVARAFAWAGAVVFAASLGYFLFSYLVTFGISASGGSALRAVTWNVALFTAFALHHSVFARERVRRWVASACPADLERSAYVWIASLLFIAVCAAWEPVPGVAWRADGLSLWVLRLLQSTGVVWTLWSAAALDVRDLAGLPPAAATQPGRRGEPEAVRPATEMVFKTTGPYGWVRHPIYTGWFLLVFAASPMTMTRLVFAAVSCAYVLVAIPFEERSLRSLPGGGYDRYMRRVRWKLVPGLFLLVLDVLGQSLELFEKHDVAV